MLSFEEVKKYVDREFTAFLSQVRDKDLVEKAYKVIYELMTNGNGGKGWKDWSMPFTLNMKAAIGYKSQSFI